MLGIVPTTVPDPHKQLLRATLLELRATMSSTELRARSQALTEHLLAHPLWQQARGLTAFVGVRGEVDTQPLLQRSLDAGKTVWLPRLIGRGVMAFWPCSDLALLEPGRIMGLREPPAIGEGIPAPGPEHGVDLILVPGLGFGRDGARIGFGAGHYDRAFAAWRGRPFDARARLCGVCLTSFVDPPNGPIPMLEHDVRMDYLATDEGVIAIESGLEHDPANR
jgi:5-formyltetrahydrofolate cyclo-ligase